MRTTFYGFEIAKSALFAAQSALDVASHNIANADTVGYTRQRLVTVSVPASLSNTTIRVDNRISSGRGVQALYVEQIRNPYLDKQYRQLASALGNSTVKTDEFSKIESLLNTELEDSDSTSALSGVFGDFYRSIYSLSEDSSSMEIRRSMLESSISMTESFHYSYNTLVDQQENVDQAVKATVDFINDTAQQIADMNDKIFACELSGEHANDLRDKRNVLLDQLSSKVDIDYTETMDNRMIVTLGGHTLVDQTTVQKLDAIQTKDNDAIVPGSGFLYEVYWQDTGEKTQIVSGELKGYLDMRDGNTASNKGIPKILEELNALARKIVSDFNEQHQQGYTLHEWDTVNNVSGSITNVKFFEDFNDINKVNAGNFAVRQSIQDDLENIAASGAPVNQLGAANSQKGNAVNALAMANLITGTNGKGDFDGTYKSIVVNVGIEMNKINNGNSSNTVRLEQIKKQRESTSGVSIDEEMTDVLRFGHSYNAASRLITAMDEQLDIIINKMGLVGR